MSLVGKVALIGLGSNLGDSARILRAASERLAAFGTVRLSSLWRTRPVDCSADAADFVNAVARLELGGGAAVVGMIDKMTAKELLRELQAIEAEFGQRNPERGAARYLDLDLLVLDDLRCADAELTVPHPRALTRHFVLYPAAEVAPDYVWPDSGKTLSELVAALPARGWGERLS